MRWPKLSVRQMMAAVAVAAVLYLVVARGTPAIVLANYHWQKQRYFESLLAYWTQQPDAFMPATIDRRNYAKEQAAYHAYWKRIFLGSSFRLWERLPVTSQTFPPRRPPPIYGE